MWTGVRRMWTSTQRIKKFTRFTCENRIFYEKTKIGHQKSWQMKYRKFAGQVPKIRKISEKRGNFSDGMRTSTSGRRGQAHMDRGRGSQKPDVRVDVINGWPVINATNE